METKNVYKFGKSYGPGVTLNQDFKFSDGGDKITGYIPRSVTQLASCSHLLKFVVPQVVLTPRQLWKGT